MRDKGCGVGINSFLAYPEKNTRKQENMRG